MEEFAAGYALREILLLFGIVIHSRGIKTRHPALGQISIGRVGQYSVGLNSPNKASASKRQSRPLPV